MTLAFLGFASLGLPDGAIGVAWPRIRESFELPLDALGLLAASVSGYAFSSFCAGALLARIRIGALLALSCAATGARLLGYWAAPSGSAMVALGVVAGLGAGAIDVGINSFAATQLPPRMRHWLHAVWPRHERRACADDALTDVQRGLARRLPRARSDPARAREGLRSDDASLARTGGCGCARRRRGGARRRYETRSTSARRSGARPRSSCTSASR